MLALLLKKRNIFILVQLYYASVNILEVYDDLLCFSYKNKG